MYGMVEGGIIMKGWKNSLYHDLIIIMVYS